MVGRRMQEPFTGALPTTMVFPYQIDERPPLSAGHIMRAARGCPMIVIMADGYQDSITDAAGRQLAYNALNMWLDSRVSYDLSMYLVWC